MKYLTIAITVSILASCNNKSGNVGSAENQQLTELSDSQNQEKQGICKINGTIFIASRGGQNFKLGLVDVYAVENKVIETYLNDSLAEKKTFLANSKKEYDSILAQYNILKPNAESAWATFRKAAMFYDIHCRVLEPHAKIIGNLVMKNSYASDHSYISAAREYYDAAKKLKEAAKSPDLSGAMECEIALNRTAKTMQDYTNSCIEHFFAYLDQYKSTVTDADGEFTLDLPQNSVYYIVVKASREIGDSTENYWFFVVNA